MKARSGASIKQTRNRLLIVISSAVVILGLLLIAVLVNSTKTSQIIVASKDIAEGVMITEDMLEARSIGTYGRSDNLPTQMEEVIGKYSLKAIAKNEYIFGSSLTTSYSKRLSDKARYGAIAIPITLVDSVAADVKENDFVGVLISMKKSKDEVAGDFSDLPNTNTKLIYSDDLVAVRVLGLFNSQGLPAGRNTKTGEVTPPAFMVVDALPIQRVLLNQARDNGAIRLIILPEPLQEDIRKAWKLTPDTQEYSEDVDTVLDEAERIEKYQKNLSTQQNSDGTEVQGDVDKLLDENKGQLDMSSPIQSENDIVDFEKEFETEGITVE